MDWQHLANNDFLLVSQFSVVGQIYTCRPDLVGFVNGLLWVVIELKKPSMPALGAFEENLTTSKRSRFSSGATRCSSPATAPTAAAGRSPPTEER